jgi:hypothetical protein
MLHSPRSDWRVGNDTERPPSRKSLRCAKPREEVCYSNRPSNELQPNLACNSHPPFPQATTTPDPRHSGINNASPTGIRQTR